MECNTVLRWLPTLCVVGVACGNPDASVSAGTPFSGVAQVQQASALPACDASLRFTVYYVVSEERLYYCDGAQWAPVSAGAQRPVAHIVAVLPVTGDECAGGGGARIVTGPDANNDGEVDEISSLDIVCIDSGSEPDPNDECPEDPNKTAPGLCGCGVAEGTCGPDDVLCGNGVVDFGEVCDDGVDNGEPLKCNSTCTETTAAECGNGVKEDGETCDDGINNDRLGKCNGSCSGTTEARCESWCATHKNSNDEQTPWSKRCNWTACGACAPCTVDQDIRLIESRHLEAAMAGADDADGHVQEYLRLLNGSGRFSDLDYGVIARDYGHQLQLHLSRTQTLAQAWARQGGAHQGSSALRNRIFDALQAWLEEDPESRNWWWRKIGWPKNGWQAPLIMKGALRAHRPELLKKWVDYLLYSWGNTPALDGANRTDVQVFTLATASLKGDFTLLEQVVRQAVAEFRFARGYGDGLYSDFSFAQHNLHGRQLHLGGYGNVYVRGFIELAQTVKGTALEFPATAVALIEGYFLNGVQRVTYGSHYTDLLVMGRGYARSLTMPNGNYFRWLLTDFLTYDPPRSDALRVVLDRISGKAGAGEQPRANTMFWHADFMTHSRPHFYTSARGTSVRTVGNESLKGAGLKSFHMGDGVNMVLHHGDEYREILPVWDGRRLPGTTVEQRQGALPTVEGGRGGAGGTDFAGGVSDGEYGLYAFIFDEGGDNANVDAHKSYFFFDDEYVALGADVLAPKANHPVVTTINQTLHKGRVTVGNGNRVDVLSGAGDVAVGRGGWVHHYDIGYVLLDHDGRGSARVAEQRGSWSDIDSSKSSAELRARVFSIDIDHGAPVDPAGRYAYVVAPGVTVGEMPGYATAPPVRVLSNTKTVQAVHHRSLNITGAVFYRAGELELADGNIVSSNQPICLLLRQVDDTLIVAAATAQYRAMSATITIDRPLSGKGVEYDAVSGRSSIPFALAGGANAGKTVLITATIQSH